MDALRGAGAMRGPLSERSLARSVAHRLKYYIDVQRKEESFDSSGVISDGNELLHSEVAYLMMQEDKKEHNFAKIKLEASLRAYVGSAEECNRKVKKSPKKQKDLEKLIKKMAQDYVPERKEEGKAKRQRKLHATATPSMSPESLRRLVSSASKLIVAATSEISPEELETTQESGSSPERREEKNLPSLGNGNKQCLSFTQSHKDEARRYGSLRILCPIAFLTKNCALKSLLAKQFHVPQ
ncbi:uncharacterized protein LOC123025107 [Varanus komodoensis]|uniref:uncharacterized protein LOC123025107 n=1 Tax=Varanus komodoensis TaxID=61221 RepID=UPI001CF7A737|nr:uncharacterized protein LOC123025107 [Varanus komodoensis]